MTAVTDEFNRGERIYVGKTTRMATVAEHIIRYEFSLAHITQAGVVVDAACGSGYGSQMLATRARHVVSLDVSKTAVGYANKHHGCPNVSYICADLDRDLPLHDESIDDVVSFETIEHLARPDRLISEFARVLRRGGHLVLSTPDRRVYSGLTGYSNPFHRVELSRTEIIDLLSRQFAIEAIYGQVRWTGSVWRSRVKQAVKRLLPTWLMGPARAVNALGRRSISGRSSDDYSLQPIDTFSHAQFYFTVVVAHKRL